jgi:alginate O-acetyltransferase complex protein AlgI
MLFDTPVYFLFLTLIVLLVWRCDHRRQNLILLAASYFFYGWWDWRFLSLILISTGVDFVCARAIERSEDPARRKLLLTVSLVLNFTFLGFFKYFNFFIDSASTLLSGLGVTSVPVGVLEIVLPPGISFYTFQAVAYIVDVYYKRLPASKSLVDYALFISLFPHLIAGPIQRPSHLLPQVQQARHFDHGKFFNGILLILSGLFRKCVIADNCALLANAAFNGQLGEPSVVVTAIGVYAFAWQIYGDFSGYSDIARGSAQLLGFHFMVNFRQPYLAASLQDFWRRWHISLSTWLRDYLYIPLGGSRNGEYSTYRNLLLTMVLGGLWHGASWTFVVWGFLHGIGLAAERLWNRGKDVSAPAGPVSLWIRRIIFFHVVCLAWVFFRAPSISEALRFLSGVAAWTWRPELGTALMFLALFSIPMMAIDLLMERSGEEYWLERRAVPLQLAWAASLVLLTVLFSGNDVNAFIYFQF